MANRAHGDDLVIVDHDVDQDLLQIDRLVRLMRADIEKALEELYAQSRENLVHLA